MSSALMPSGSCCSRQQQARFQIGEPRRHHQIIGGELEPQFARLFDEGEILIGQRQDRDFREIDLLLARERQQKVERTFKTLDVDDERGLVRARSGKIGRRTACLRRSCVPLRRLPDAVHQLSETRRGWRRDRSAPPASLLASAASARRARFAGEHRRLRGDRAHLRHLPVAVKHHIAAGRDRGARALGNRSGQGAHGNVVAHQQAFEANRITNHVTHYSCRNSGRRDRGR